MKNQINSDQSDIDAEEKLEELKNLFNGLPSPLESKTGEEIKKLLAKLTKEQKSAIGGVKLFHFYLEHEKQKNMSSLLRIVKQLGAVKSNKVDEELKKKCMNQLQRFKSFSSFMSTNEPIQKVRELSMLITNISKMETWATEVAHPYLVERLTKFCRQKIEKDNSQETLFLLQVPRQNIIDKDKIFKDHFQYRMNRSRGDSLLPQIFQILINKFDGYLLDLIKTYIKYSWKEKTKLEALIKMFDKTFKNSKTEKNFEVGNFNKVIETILNFTYQIDIKTAEQYFDSRALNWIQKREIESQILEKWVKDHIVEYYKKLPVQKKQGYLVRVDGLYLTQLQASLLLLQDQSSGSIIKDFYLGVYKNYSALQVDRERGKGLLLKFSTMVVQLQLNHEQVVNILKNGKKIQSSLEFLKKEAGNILKQVQSLNAEYMKNLKKLQNIVQVLKFIENENIRDLFIHLQKMLKTLKQSKSVKQLNVLPKQLQQICQSTEILKIVGTKAIFLTILQQKSADIRDSIKWVLQCIDQFYKKIQHYFEQIRHSQTFLLSELYNFYIHFSKQELLRLDQHLKLRNCQINGSCQKIIELKQKLNEKKLKQVSNFLKSLNMLKETHQIDIGIDFNSLLQSHICLQKILSQLSSNQNCNQKGQLTLGWVEDRLQDIEKLLQRIQIPIEQIDKNPTVEILSKLYLNGGIFVLACAVTENELENLKDYILEDDENMVSIIEQFETIMQLTQKVSTNKQIKPLLIEIGGLDKKLKEKNHILSLNITHCNGQINSISIKLEQSKNRTYNFQHKIKSILSNFVFQIQLDDLNYNQPFFFIGYDDSIQANTKKISFKQLKEYRDKTILLVGEKNIKQTKQNDKIQLFTKYHQVFQILQKLQKYICYLLKEGLSIDALQLVEAEKGNFKICESSYAKMDELQQLGNKMMAKYKQFGQSIRSLWSSHYLACHFNGKMMRSMTDNILSNRSDPVLKRISNVNPGSVLDTQTREKIRQKINSNKVGQIFEGYSMIFNKLKKGQVVFNQDFPISIYNQEEENMYKILICRNQNIRPQSILFCCGKTSQLEIERFLIRSANTHQQSYVIDSYRLSQKSEVFIFEKLYKMKEQKTLGKSKLVFIESKRDHQAFQILTSRKFKYKSEKLKNLTINLGKICQKLGQCKIVCSSQASSGKTFYILQQIKKLERKPKFLSLNGQIDTEKIKAQLGELNLDEDKDSLVIEVSYSRNLKIMSQILGRILILRSLGIDHQKISDKVPIFVEIANIHGVNFEEQLPILKLLSQIKGFIIKIQPFTIESIDLSNPSQEMVYVGEMLRLLNQQKIDEQQFKQVQSLPSNFKNLISKYLFEPLIQKNEQVSGYLYKSFIEKLYDNFRAFNSGFFSLDAIKILRQKSKLAKVLSYFKHLFVSQTNHWINMRSSILSLMITNTRDFLKQYLNTEKSGLSRQDFRTQLKNMGLLILPCSQGGFSFVFSDSNKVPDFLKFYMCQQQQDLLSKKQIKFEQLFDLKSMSDSQRYQQIVKRLRRVTGASQSEKIQISPNYKLTQDNFFKMCVILYRIQSGIPVVLMGESGVGKTSLITELANIIKAKLLVFQVHAGKRKKDIEQFIESIFNEQGLSQLFGSSFREKQQIFEKIQMVELQQMMNEINELRKKFGLCQKQVRQLKQAAIDKQVINQNFTRVNAKKFQVLFKSLLSKAEVKNILKGRNEQVNQVKSSTSFPRLVVLIDQYNTTEELSTFKQLIIDRRYKNKHIPSHIVFIACCNPYRENKGLQISSNPDAIGLNFKRSIKPADQANLSFKVQRPPQSLRIVTEDYQQLNQAQTKIYVEQILREVKIDSKKVAEIITKIHSKLHERYGYSSASLRDIQRFRILYKWFDDSLRKLEKYKEQEIETLTMIVTLCVCYVSKAQSQYNKNEVINCISTSVSMEIEKVKDIYEAIQQQFIRKMVMKQKTILNKALKENVFHMLVGVMNKISTLTIGVPGSSKSLALSLIQNNLKGQDSKSDFYKKYPQVRMIPFQASQNTTSQAIQNLFDKLDKICKRMKKYKNIIYVAMIDQIGLAEYSPDNPLKVLHSRIELTQKNYSVVAISNWGLDNAKASRFLICSRSFPTLSQIKFTALQILRSYFPKQIKKSSQSFIEVISQAYYTFIEKWRTNPKINKGFPQFFGLRDFYSLIHHYLSFLSKQSSLESIKKAIQINFDGQEGSAEMFKQIFEDVNMKNKQSYGLISRQRIDPLTKCDLILNTLNSRCIMLIMPSDTLVPLILEKYKSLISLHGSNFEEDLFNDDYNLRKIAEITYYISNPNIVLMKDMNEVIYTALYDLFNKNYLSSGGKNFCRIASGVHIRPKVEVSDRFNAIVVVEETDIYNNKIDSAFLNRFCKIFLRLDMIVTAEEISLVKKIQNWMESLIKKTIGSNHNLNRSNFIVNSSERALYSLAIKVNKFSLSEGESQMKKILMRNSTFQLMILNSKIKQSLADFNKGIQLQDKGEQKQKEKDCLVFTYDVASEYEEDTLFEELGRSKTIILEKVRKDQSLDEEMNELDGYNLVKIKMNYENHHKFLNQIIFKIGEVKKKSEEIKQKVFVIIVFMKRNKINSEDLCFSYLTPIRQLFIPILPKKSRSHIKVESIIKAKNLLQLYRAIKKNENIQISEKYINNSFDRLQPNFMVNEQDKQLVESYYNQLRKDYISNKAFKSFVLQQVQENLEASLFNQEIVKSLLNDNEAYSRSIDISDYLVRFIDKQIQDRIVSLLLFLAEKGNLFQFNRNLITKMLTLDDDNIKICVEEMKQELDKIFALLSQKRYKKLILKNKAKRGIQSNPITLEYPYLFPYFKHQKSLYFSSNESLSGSDESATDMRLISEKLMSEQYMKTSQASRIKQGNKPKDILKDAERQFNKKSLFSIEEYDQQTQKFKIVWSYLQQIKKNQKLAYLLLFDIVSAIYYQKIQTHNSLIPLLKVAQNFLSKTNNLAYTVVGLAGDQETMKYICLILNSLKQAQHSYKYDIQFTQANPALLAKQYVNNIISLLSEENKESLMIGRKVRGAFGSISLYCRVVPKLNEYLKKLEENQYLQINLSIQFNLFSRWLMRLQQIFFQPNDFIKAIQYWIQQEQSKGFYVSILNTCGWAIKNKNFNQLKQQKVDELLRFMGSKVLFCWYVSQVQDALENVKFEDEQSECNVFFHQFCSLSNEYSQISDSINHTLCRIFQYVNDQEQDSEDGEQAAGCLKRLVRIIQKQKRSQIDNKIIKWFNMNIVSKMNSNICISINNFVWRIYQHSKQEKCEQTWDIAFKNIKDEEHLDSLVNLISFSLCKAIMKKYIDNQYIGDFNQLSARVNKDMVYNSSSVKSLSFFAFKCLRRKYHYFQQFSASIEKKNIGWMKSFIKNENFEIYQAKQIKLAKPNNISNHFSKLISDFIKNIDDIQITQKLFESVSNNEQLYWLLTNLMTKIYFSNYKHTQPTNWENKAINPLSKQLIKFYFQHQFEPIFSASSLNNDSHIQYNSQLPYFNMLNWFAALSQTQSPLINSFLEQGGFSHNFSDWIKDRFIICGPQNPFRTTIQNILSNSKRDHGVYKCSKQCDFIYTYSRCGYPSKQFICGVCKQESGGKHYLNGVDRGAKRLGPTLYKSKEAGKIYSRERHQIQANIKLQHLTNNQAYWKSFPHYLKKEALQISNKRSVKIQGGEISLCGYAPQFQKSGLDDITRMHWVTRDLLRILSCTIMLFASKVGWIKEEEIKKAFFVNKEELLQCQKQQISKCSSRLEQDLQVNCEKWVLSITKQIFQTSKNYVQEVKLLRSEKQLELKSLIQEILSDIGKGKYKDWEKLFINEVIVEDLKKFQKDFKQDWMTTSLYSRQNFQTMIDKKVRKYYLHEERNKFLINSFPIKEDGKELFIEQLTDPKNHLSSYPLIYHTSYVQQLPHQRGNLSAVLSNQKWLETYKSQLGSYKFLQHIVSNMDICKRLEQYRNILFFIKQLMDICDNKLDRMTSKKKCLQVFLNQLPENQSQRLKELFQHFQRSWQMFVMQNGGEINSDCKVIGKFSKLSSSYTINYFLPDSKEDVRNVPGLAILHAINIISQDYNNQLTQLYQLAGRKIPKLVINPGYVHEKAWTNFDLEQLKNQIEQQSNHSCKYGNTRPKICFGSVSEIIIDETLKYAYLLEKRIKRIRQVVYKGQNLYTEKNKTCLQEIKGSYKQKDLPQSKYQQLERYIIKQSEKNKDKFYNNCRDYLDCLQIVMIKYRKFEDETQERMKIQEFASKQLIKNEIQVLLEQKIFSSVQICYLVGLFEIIEDSICYKAEQIIPEQYKLDKEQAEQQLFKQVTKYLNDLLFYKQSNDIISLQMLYRASQRLVLRRMLSFDIEMSGQQIGYQLLRKDLWPKNIKEEMLEILAEKIKLKVSHFYVFFKEVKRQYEQHPENKCKKQMKEPQKDKVRNVDNPVKDNKNKASKGKVKI